MKFRADIQGLRAAAVIVVVAYHAEISGFRGGFIGVDVFFVLSGFLITGLLLAERESTGSINLHKFFGRRVRRLLPASVFVALATVGIGRVVLNVLDYKVLLTDGFWSLLFSANLRFAFEGIDYLGADQVPSALEHYWSLGVEEQFYIFWPFVLVLVGRRLPWVAAALFSLSFAAAVLTVGPWAFYGLHTRIWEFMVGAGLAMSWPRIAALGPRTRTAIGVGGVLGLTVSMFLITSQSSWPGPITLLPILGTAGLLANPSTALVARVLSHSVLGWIGDRSYSLYLTHVPVLVFAEVVIGDRLSLLQTAFAIGVAVMLAHALYQLVESPIRKSAWLSVTPMRSMSFGVLAVAIGLVLLSSLSLVGSSTGGTGQVALDTSAPPESASLVTDDLDRAAEVEIVPANLRPALGAVRDDRPSVYASGCHLNIESTALADCQAGAIGAETTWVLIGDSHAAQWAPAWEALALESGAELRLYTKSGCPPMDVDVFSSLLDRTYTECRTWVHLVTEEIARTSPDVVFVSVAAAHRTTIRGSELDWSDQLKMMLEQLQPSNGQVVLISDTPSPGTDVPACLVENLASASTCVAAATGAQRSSQRLDEQQATASAGVLYLDLLDLMCGLHSCPVIVDDVLVYRDASHVTTVFAASRVDQIARKLTELGVLS